MKTMSLKNVKTIVALSIFMIASALIFVKCKATDLGVDAPICMKYSKGSEPTLTKDFIFSMIKNYKNNQLRVINSKDQNGLGDKFDNLGDTQAISFKLDELKKFIYHVENSAKNKKINANELSIRFYLAAYPSNNDDKIKRNRTTLIALPTVKIDNKETVINLLEDENINEFDKNLRNNFKASSKNIQQKDVVMALNHGSLIPPY